MWEGLRCELCSTSYEDLLIKDGDSTIDLLGIDLPTDSHYIFLESVNTEEILKKEFIKVVHIIDFNEKKELTLGRGHDCEVRITDISISRHHGVFRVIKN